MKAITEDFRFSSPTETIFGVGSAGKIGEKAAAMGRRALIVTDSYLSASASMEAMVASLKGEGVESVVLDNVVPNPLDEDVHEGVELYNAKKCDLIVAVGGGSSIDSGKTIGSIVTNGGRTQDMLAEGAVRNPLPPFIAVPTTAGTGAEVTIFAVITDAKTHEKLILFSHNLLPAVAILDPELTLSLPSRQTAFTGLDALTHALESYTATMSNPVSDGLCCYALELVGKYLSRAYRNGKDLEARSGMLLASHMAGIAFSNTDLGSVHTMGETLAGACSIPHGAAMAIFLPYVMEFSLKATADKYARVARLMGLEVVGMSDEQAARQLIEHIKQLERDLAVPPLAKFDVKPSDFPKLSKVCKGHVCDPLNPKAISEAEYLNLYQMAYDNAYKI